MRIPASHACASRQGMDDRTLTGWDSEGAIRDQKNAVAGAETDGCGRLLRGVRPGGRARSLTNIRRGVPQQIRGDDGGLYRADALGQTGEKQERDGGKPQKPRPRTATTPPEIPPPSIANP